MMTIDPGTLAQIVMDTHRELTRENRRRGR